MATVSTSQRRSYVSGKGGRTFTLEAGETEDVNDAELVEALAMGFYTVGPMPEVSESAPPKKRSRKSKAKSKPEPTAEVLSFDAVAEVLEENDVIENDDYVDKDSA